MLSHTEYASHDAVGLADLVRKGDTTASELLEIAIARADCVNPHVNALCLRMYEEARSHVAALRCNGALAGVPFLLKDITTHATGWRMTSGSRVFRDYVSSFDSSIVERYRAAGLVLFGRTTAPEFGYAATNESRLYGPTRNPWDLSRTSGGSSGGAAAAVATGVVPVAQGGDAGGSLRIPASWCGLFGLKPTRARTPVGPAHGAFLGFSAIHVIGRSVRDSALLLDLTHGPDVGAPYHAPEPNGIFLEATHSRPGRMRIAVQRRAYDGSVVDPECLAAVEHAAILCRQLGHEVIDVDIRFDHAKLRDLYFIVWPALVLRTLEQHAETTGRAWRPEDLEIYVARLVESVRGLAATRFVEGLENVNRVARDFRVAAERYDVVLSPTTANVAPAIGVLDPSSADQDRLDTELARAVAFTQIYNVTGQPAASVPLHWSEDGLPVGVQIGGRYGNEALLFSLAAELERARPWQHRLPRIPAFRQDQN